MKSSRGKKASSKSAARTSTANKGSKKIRRSGASGGKSAPSRDRQEQRGRAPKPARSRTNAGGESKQATKSAVKRAVVRKTETPRTEPKAPLPPVVDVAMRALEDIKAVNVKLHDVRGRTDFADAMIVASGNSDRHVRSIADRVVEFAKKAGFRPLGVEGERDGEWVLVDLQDVVVHVMLPRVREYYRLDDFWDVAAARREAAGQ